MGDVSLLAVDFWVTWLDREGLDLADLLAGTRLHPDDLRVPGGRIRWSDFTVLLANFESIVGGPRALSEVMRGYIRSEPQPPAALLVALGHPIRAYRAINGFMGHQLFRIVEGELSERSRLEVGIELRIPDGYDDSPAFFWACKGVLSEVATLSGWPPARVRLTVTERHGRYDITLQEPKRRRFSLSAWLPGRAELKRAAEELSRYQAELQGSYRALARANLHMQHQAERERRLARIGRRLAAQVTLGSLLDTLGEICADELGLSGIVVKVADQRELVRGALTGPTVCHVLRRGERELGTLTVPDGEAGLELLERLLPWMALAVDNALHFEAAAAHGEALESQLAVQARITAALEASEARWRALVASLPDFVITLDREGSFTFVNRARHGLTLEDVVGSDVAALVPDPEPFAERLQRVFRDAVPVEHETAWSGPDGTEHWFSYRLNPIVRDGVVTSVVLVVRDETERRRAELERHQFELRALEGQKLESLGVLAGGIAHDFNNLLMGITANAELAELHLPEGHPARPYVRRIETAGNRAGDLTRQMLAYAGRRTVRPEPVDVNALIRDLGDLLQAALPKRVQLDWALDPHLPPVEADPAQLQQVVLNVLKNAADAIGDQAGTVTLRTAVRDPSRAPKTGLRGEPLPDGPYVVIEIADTGEGMQPDVQRRIFDPFFSTKATGRGLGLAAVVGVVRAHRGTLAVRSTPGAGTNFQVLLPASPAAVATPPLRDRAHSTRLRGRTVLVVDDEPVVRQVAADLLAHHGALVLTAADGIEGLRTFEAHPEIDVVLLDLTMPGPSGDEVFDAMRDVRPDARVLLTSGYDPRDAISSLRARGLAGFLRKPWDGKSLVEVVSRTAAG